MCDEASRTTTGDGPDGARRGRPAALDPAERAARILDAFEDVVGERGLRGATMDAVAQAAGMSKRTLYAVFGDRAHLFDAWVARIGSALVRPLTPAEADLPLGDRLRLMLRREVEGAASLRRIVVLRALIAEAARMPELGRALRRDAAEAAVRRLADELARAARRGEAHIADAEAAARLLLDMACINPIGRMLDPDSPPPTAAEAQARLDLALGVFLRGVA